MTFDLPRTSVLASLALVLAGYILVFRPLEAAVAQRYAAIDDARATLARRNVLAADIPGLERERRRREEQVRQLHMGEHRAAVVERFLRTIVGVSARDAVAVQTVAAAPVQPPPPGRSASPPILEALPLDVTLRGRYADVIRAARDLNSADVAARITFATLGNAQAKPGDRPLLNAAFHVTLLREADESSIPPARAL